MGSCVSKYQIPDQERHYNGELGSSRKIPVQKYKSVSSKNYEGTNTFEDVLNQNRPVAGDIYSHFNSALAYRARTSPSLPAPPSTDSMRIQYGLNPYEMKQEAYNRSRTDNLAYNNVHRQNMEQNNASMAGNHNIHNKNGLNFSRKSKAFNHYGQNNEEQDELSYSQFIKKENEENKKEENLNDNHANSIRLTQSRYV